MLKCVIRVQRLLYPLTVTWMQNTAVSIFNCSLPLNFTIHNWSSASSASVPISGPVTGRDMQLRNHPFFKQCVLFPQSVTTWSHEKALFRFHLISDNWPKIREGWSRNISGGLATTYGIRYPAEIRFFSSPWHPARLWGLSNGHRGEISQRLKGTGSETQHSTPSSAKVNSVEPIPPTRYAFMA
jgi:hypothetical protein